MKSFERIRKGEISQGELVVIILVVITVVVLLLFFSKLRGNFEQAEEGVCAAQVQEADFRNRLVGRDYALELAACQPNYITIRRDDLPSEWEKADLQVKKLLAENMRKCWFQWGRGEADLFKDEGEYCAMCSVIYFDEKIREEYNQNSEGYIKGFNTYLEENNIPGSELSYAEYFRGINRDKTNNEILNVPAFAIKMEENYTTFFAYNKIKVDGDRLSNIGSAFGADITPVEAGKIGATVGGVAGGSLGALAGLKLVSAAAAGMGGPLGSMVAASGPVGWAAVGVVVAAGVTYVGVKTIVPAVKGFILGGALGYVSARTSEEFAIISAIYITPATVDSPYIQACKTMASQLSSP